MTAVRYVDSGATEWTADPAWLAVGISNGIQAVAARVSANAGLPLIAMPMFGTGAGGFAELRGEALEAILAAARQGAELTGCDVVIICWSRSDFAALQSKRPVSDFAALDQRERATLDEAANQRRNDNLCLFLGAGVSMAAGLPSFETLLAAIGDDEVDVRPGASLPGVAGDIECRIGRQALLDGLRRELAPTEPVHSLAHGLLASLRVEEVVTTNFDSLFELASQRPYEEKLVVVPAKAHGRGPWLLKAHGDIDDDDLTITARDYQDWSGRRRQLSGVLTSMLVLRRQLLFIGYAVRDENVLELMQSAATFVAETSGVPTTVGAVLAVEPAPDDYNAPADWVQLGGVDLAASIRQLLLGLDYLAWQCSRDEPSWQLDPRYRSLLPADEAAAATTLTEATVPSSWTELSRAFRDHGRPDPVARAALGHDEGER